jgi:intracellular septation protein
MKFLFDLIPVFVFFVAYFFAERSPDAAAAMTSSLLGALGLGTELPPKQAPILLSTFCAIVATFGQVGWLMLRRKPIDKMLWISLGIIVVMGGLTLAFRDPTFIKWKPTVLYWAFGATLLISERIFKRNLMRSMTQGQFEMPDRSWVLLNLSWVGFFIFMGVLNLWVAFNFSESTWVKFKLFGGMGLMVVFALGQGFVLARHLEHHEERK